MSWLVENILSFKLIVYLIDMFTICLNLYIYLKYSFPKLNIFARLIYLFCIIVRSVMEIRVISLVLAC